MVSVAPSCDSSGFRSSVDYGSFLNRREAFWWSSSGDISAYIHFCSLRAQSASLLFDDEINDIEGRRLTAPDGMSVRLLKD
jgi:hypothetical protein